MSFNSCNEDLDDLDDLPPPNFDDKAFEKLSAPIEIVKEDDVDPSKIKLKKVPEKEKHYVSYAEMIARLEGRLDSKLFQLFKIGKSGYVAQPKEERKLDFENEFKDAKSLSDFGYKFNKKHELVTIKNEQKFKYVDQEHYDWLGLHVIRYIFDQYIKPVKEGGFGLKEKWIPESLNERESKKNWLERKQVNIFHSENAFTTDGPVCVFLNGAGLVRAGIWSMKLCCNNSLNEGTIFGYLQKCRERNWEVIVLNPNRNKTRLSGEEIESSKNPYVHALFAFDEVIMKCKSKELFIIAHSFGGCITIESLLFKREVELMKKLKAIAFTDSVHLKLEVVRCSEDVQKYLLTNARNFVQSFKPKDKYLGVINGVTSFASGTNKHIWTSHFAIDAVFRFLDINEHIGSTVKKKFEQTKKFQDEGKAYLKEKKMKEALEKFQLAKDCLYLLRCDSMTKEEDLLFDEYDVNLNKEIESAIEQLKK